MSLEWAEALKHVERAEKQRRRGGQHCPCGRFAKHLRSEWRYNGTHNVLWVKTRCSRCGEQEVPYT